MFNYKARFLLVAAVFFVLSAYYAWVEVRYALWGKNADAAVVKVEQVEHRGRRGSVTTKLEVTYRFTDESMKDLPPPGPTRTESDEVGLNWSFAHDPAPGSTIAVQYIPYSESSRLAGNSKDWAVWVMLVALLALGGFGAFYYFDFRKHEAAKARSNALYAR